MDEQRSDINMPEARAKEAADPVRRDPGDAGGRARAKPRRAPRRGRRLLLWLLLLAAIVAAAVWLLPRLSHKPAPAGHADGERLRCRSGWRRWPRATCRSR